MSDVRSSILIVEDSARARSLLERYLKEQGFHVIALPDGRKVLDILGSRPVQLIVLDLMLPGEDGLSVCRRIRQHGEDVPIIMLTAKADEVDRVVGLEIGADDYVTKPFSPRELVARINAVLRRHQPALGLGAPAIAPEIFRFGKCELNKGTRVLTKSGKGTPLTTGEFAVLDALVTHLRRPLSRDKLMELARGKEHGAFDRSMDVQISRLRRLIEDNPAQPRYLQTVWGVGYVFVPDDEPS